MRSHGLIKRLLTWLRMAALALYVLCYGLAGAVLLFILVALLLALAGAKSQGETNDRWLGLVICAVGFSLGCLLAWRARSNALAHYSVVACGSVQMMAAIIWGRQFFRRIEPEMPWNESLGLSISGILMYAVAAVAGVALLGAVCGRIANARPSCAGIRA